MSRYLFRFGFCTPVQFASNSAHGWDDEASSSFFIEAESSDQALEWGEEVADRFVQALFAAEGGEVFDWRASDFARWIDDSPEEEYSARQLANKQVVKVGEFPDFTKL